MNSILKSSTFGNCLIALWVIGMCFHIFNPTQLSFLIIQLLSVLTLAYNNKKVQPTIKTFLIIIIGVSSYVILNHKAKNDDGYIYKAYVKNYSQNNKSLEYNYDLIFHDNNGSSHYIRVADYNCYKNDTLLVCVRQEKSSIANGNPTKGDLEKYTFPVPSNSTFVDLGNDSYEYAKYERDIAYKNFGLNIVQVAKSFDSNIIYFTKLNGEKFYIKEPNGGNDTFLVYSNINPKFFDGWHICNDSLCTPENFTKIEEDGYGYIFRGKIYSKDETEKCWNIIEQYKLRESEKQTQQ